MAAVVRCACGNVFEAQDQWHGRMVVCARCGQSVAVPALSSSQGRGTQGRDTFGFFRRLLGGKQRIFYWREPLFCWPRLRGELGRRLIVPVAVWGIVSGLLLIAFGVNREPPSAYSAILWGAFFGLLLGLLLAFTKVRIRGSVSITESDMHYGFQTGSWNPMILGYLHWWEGPYEVIRRCVIVPGEVLGKGFAVMLLYVDSEVHEIGIPRRIDLYQLKDHFVSKDVTVEFGDSLPKRLTEPMSIAVPTVVGVLGTLFLMGSLAFYHVQTAEIREVRQRVAARRAQLEQISQVPGRPIAGERLQASSALDRVMKRPWEVTGEQSEDEPPVVDDREPKKTFPPDTAREPPRFVPSPKFAVPPGLPDRPFFGQDPQPEVEARPQPPVPVGSADFGGRAHPPLIERMIGSGATELVGGSGGVPFRSASDRGEAVVGFRWRMGTWAGQAALSSLEPLFDRAPGPGSDTTIVAREGYAVGALQIDAPQFVQAIRVQFMRIKDDGRLDPDDSYESDWIGRPGHGSAVMLGGNGDWVIGICGRRAAVLDALGLVIQDR